MADMGIRVHIIGLKRSQRSIRDGSTSQNILHELYKLCAKFHAVIKKCTIHSFSLSMLLYHREQAAAAV